MPDNDLLPDGETFVEGGDNQPVDFGDLRVNFTQEEAASEGRSTKLLETGDYVVRLVDGEIKACSPASNNPGKPYYALSFAVQNGPHKNRRLFSNVMLFNPALYSLSQLMKALGYPVTAGQIQVPGIQEMIELQRDIVVGVAQVGKQTDKKDPTKEYAPKNEIKSYMPYDPAKAGQIAAAGAKKGSSLLPG